MAGLLVLYLPRLSVTLLKSDFAQQAPTMGAIDQTRIRTRQMFQQGHLHQLTRDPTSSCVRLQATKPTVRRPAQATVQHLALLSLQACALLPCSHQLLSYYGGRLPYARYVSPTLVPFVCIQLSAGGLCRRRLASTPTPFSQVQAPCILAHCHYHQSNVCPFVAPLPVPGVPYSFDAGGCLSLGGGKLHRVQATLSQV